MNYQTHQKIVGKSNFKGFYLNKDTVFLEQRAKKVISIIAKARINGLNAFYVVVDSRGTSKVASDIRSLSKRGCCFLDIDKGDTHHVAIFNTMSISENKKLFEKNGQKVLSIEEYDLSDDNDLTRLTEDCCLLFAQDNESFQSHKRYFNASHLTEDEKCRSIQKVVTIETIQ